MKIQMNVGQASSLLPYLGTSVTAWKPVLLGLALFTLNLPIATTLAQGTAFAYQGSLADNGAPANGVYDLRFVLYNAEVGGSQQGPALTNAVGVSNGLFAVTLDFGDQFPGADRWAGDRRGHQ